MLQETLVHPSFVEGMVKEASAYARIMQGVTKGIGTGANVAGKALKSGGKAVGNALTKPVKNKAGETVGRRIGLKRVAGAGLGGIVAGSALKSGKQQQDRYGQAIGPTPMAYQTQSSMSGIGR